MKKILNIGWKDLIVLFRDRGALILMLGAPFVLTLGLGLVTGSFNRDDGNSGMGNIPVVIVNQDGEQLGQALEELFFSDDLADLLTPATAVSPTTARQQVDDDEIAAAVIIPAGFTASILPDTTSGQTGETVIIEVYANPGRPIGASVVTSIVNQFISQVEVGLASVNVAMTQLVMNGRLPLNDPAALQTTGAAMAQRLFTDGPETATVVVIERETAVPGDTEFNYMAYIAPGMAVAFLMYTVALGGRSILAERDEGTLARLMVSPTSSTQVLAGKVVGIFLTGAAQVSVLILASSLLFGLRWGNWLGVVLLIISVSAAATGWGLLLAAIAKRPGQVASYGTALMLSFGILGGSFVQLPLSGPMVTLSKITPNAWAIQGFTALGQGGDLTDVLIPVLAMAGMAVVLFVTAVVIFQRRAGALIAR
jgi:ABC-2 type transport system permease protein